MGATIREMLQPRDLTNKSQGPPHKAGTSSASAELNWLASRLVKHLDKPFWLFVGLGHAANKPTAFEFNTPLCPQSQQERCLLLCREAATPGSPAMAPQVLARLFNGVTPAQHWEQGGCLEHACPALHWLWLLNLAPIETASGNGKCTFLLAAVLS